MMNKSLSLRAKIGLTLTAYAVALKDWRTNLGLSAGRAQLRVNRWAAKYTGWIMLFAVAGTLSAVAAVAITEAFVPSTLLVLTVGEWELLAAVFYILAILLYLGEGGYRMSGRGVAPPVFGSTLRLRRREPTARIVQHDAAYAETLEVAEA